jgi:hypothetical protein
MICTKNKTLSTQAVSKHSAAHRLHQSTQYIDCTQSTQNTSTVPTQSDGTHLVHTETEYQTQHQIANTVPKHTPHQPQYQTLRHTPNLTPNQARHQAQCQSHQQIRYQPAVPINRNTKQPRHRTLTVLVTHNTIHDTTVEVSLSNCAHHATHQLPRYT